VLSKFSKQSLGLAITAGALGFGLFIGSAGPSRAQAPPAAPAAPTAQSTQEFNEADAAQKENDPAKRLALLDTWKKDFPTTPIVDARHAMYLTTYFSLKMFRQAFDQAQEIIKDHPADAFAPTAYADALQSVMQIKPAPTKEDLDTGEKNALAVLDNAAIFAAANKPAELPDAQWAQTKAAVQNYAEATILPNIYLARKDDKREVEDLTKLINRDNNLYTASYQLGLAMQRIIKAEQKPENQPPMFWQFARAITGAPPATHVLPAATKTSATKYLTDAYTLFHGSADGLQDLIAQAKTSPFPPAGWTLKSNVDIAKEKAAEEDKRRAADPLGTLWTQDVKASLLKDDAAWENTVKGAGLPPPNADGTPQYFKGTIISMTPATKPKEIIVGIAKSDVADAKLKFDTALPGKMEPGEIIQFKGLAEEFQKDPFMITFSVDMKDDMNGSWTGKNAAPPKGPVNTKAKSTGKAAANLLRSVINL
jgi:hypothetical protein